MQSSTKGGECNSLKDSGLDERLQMRVPSDPNTIGPNHSSQQSHEIKADDLTRFSISSPPHTPLGQGLQAINLDSRSQVSNNSLTPRSEPKLTCIVSRQNCKMSSCHGLRSRINIRSSIDSAMHIVRRRGQNMNWYQGPW